MAIVKKAIKYGIPLGIGTIGGIKIGLKIAEAVEHEQVDGKGEGDIWEGPTRTLPFEEEVASDILDTIYNLLESERFVNDIAERDENIFLLDDLKDMSTKIQHELGDMTEDDMGIEIEMTDRQRLVLYDWIIGPGEDFLLQIEEEDKEDGT